MYTSGMGGKWEYNQTRHLNEIISNLKGGFLKLPFFISESKAHHHKAFCSSPNCRSFSTRGASCSCSTGAHGLQIVSLPMSMSAMPFLIKSALIWSLFEKSLFSWLLLFPQSDATHHIPPVLLSSTPCLLTAAKPVQKHFCSSLKIQSNGEYQGKQAKGRGKPLNLRVSASIWQHSQNIQYYFNIIHYFTKRFNQG